MSYQDTQIVRLKTIQVTDNNAVDVVTGERPVVWRAAGLRIDLGAFQADETTLRDDIGDFSSITLEVKSSPDRRDPALMSKTVAAVDMTPGLLIAAWNDGSGQHASFEFTDSETNLDLRGENQRELWLVLRGISTPDSVPVIIGATHVLMLESGGGTASPSTDGITLTEADARYVKKSGDTMTGNLIFNNQNVRIIFGKGLEIYDPTLVKWMVLGSLNGLPTLTPDDDNP